MRALNHATLPGAGGLAYPADAYEVTGQLSVLAARLPQALAQLLAFLAEQAAAGRIQVAAGQHAGDPAAVLTAVTASLDAAAASARRLQRPWTPPRTTSPGPPAPGGNPPAAGAAGPARRAAARRARAARAAGRPLIPI